MSARPSRRLVAACAVAILGVVACASAQVHEGSSGGGNQPRAAATPTPDTATVAACRHLQTVLRSQGVHPSLDCVRAVQRDERWRRRHRRVRPRVRAFPTPGPAGYCHRSGDGIYAQADRRPGCTPGLWVSDRRILQTPAASEYDPDTSPGHVCATAYNPRPLESVTQPLKYEDLAIYGLPRSDGAITESDHYYPVWSGGATVLQNLNPEPNYPGVSSSTFYRNPKDKLEIALNRLVCHTGAPGSAMSVRQARAVFEARSWLPGYRKYVGPTS